MLSKICLVFAVLISIVWIVSLTVLVGCGAVWVLQKLGGM
nr:MAG TPA_asm: Glycine rich protein family [Caudoviricetes sp.]